MMNNVIRYISGIFLLIAIVIPVNAQENLNLSQALEKALENNYGIAIAKAEKQIAARQNNWGNAGALPSVNFSASSSNSFELLDEDRTNSIYAGLGINWTLFSGFRIQITKDKLTQLENLASGRSAVVVENTIQNVILNYYNILLQQERLAVLKDVMQLSEDRLKYEELKKEIGGSVSYNVLQAKNNYLSDKATVLRQENAVRSAVRSLNFLLGMPASTSWDFTEAFETDTLNYQMANLRDKMLESNQVLQNQYINLMLTKKDIELQRSTLYPTLSVSAGMDNSKRWFKQQGIPVVESESLTPYGNLSLSYSIYQGGTRKQAIEVAEINASIENIATEEIKHSLTNELFGELDLYNLRKELLNVADESLETAALNLQIAEEKYKTGAINSFNYRDIQLIYLNAALQKLQAVYDLIDANTRLTRITGGFIGE